MRTYRLWWLKHWTKWLLTVSAHWLWIMRLITAVPPTWQEGKCATHGVKWHSFSNCGQGLQQRSAAIDFDQKTTSVGAHCGLFNIFMTGSWKEIHMSITIAIARASQETIQQNVNILQITRPMFTSNIKSNWTRRTYSNQEVNCVIQPKLIRAFKCLGFT